MSKKNQILTNGVVLTIIDVFLAAYFTVKELWGVAQVFVIIILAAAAGLQFFIRIRFFEDNKGLKIKKSLDNKGKL